MGDAALPPETPLVLTGRNGNRRVVLAADAAAVAAGLRIGMAATKAQALVPGLLVHDAAPEADAEALERLALWALRRYAPVIASDPPDGLVIDTTGADHLHGGESAMLADLVDRLAASGFAARAAIADSWGAAHALARWVARPTLVVPVGQSAAAMMTVYGPRSAAEAMIARVVRVHDAVRGETPDGTPIMPTNLGFSAGSRQRHRSASSRPIHASPAHSRRQTSLAHLPKPNRPRAFMVRKARRFL